MEFNEKLQLLRKQKGITQEDLAQALFVSRAAVSKWESGRGYPGIDSLKALASFFGITVDELLSGDELLTLVEAETKQKGDYFCDMVFGLLDLCIALFFFLPFFRQTENADVQEVSLLSLSVIAPWLRVVYFCAVVAVIAMGVLTLALQKCQNPFWMKNKIRISLGLTSAGIILFIISPQPYAAVFMFALLVIKALLLKKRQ